ncbi:antitoxin YefM [Bacteroidia bacterium]|nr:antitoxin YefM [Bacteroidia bacterium]GHV19698.1 antitoxin YefM [Bacteroidia bacterium]
MKTASYTDFRSNMKLYMDSVIDNSDTVVINRKGGTGVVLMSLEEYNSLVETEYIMSSPEMVRRINDAKNSICEGKGKKIATKDLWK